MKWTNAQKAAAKTWVSCISLLLRDEQMDKAQMSFIKEVMPALMTEATKAAVKWPRNGNGPRDWWQYTHSQQMLWALALVLALGRRDATERLMVDAVAAQTADPEAPMGSEYVLQRVNLEIQEPHYDNMFRTRCLTAGRLLSGYMQVTLLERERVIWDCPRGRADGAKRSVALPVRSTRESRHPRLRVGVARDWFRGTGPVRGLSHEQIIQAAFKPYWFIVSTPGFRIEGSCSVVDS